VFSSLPPSDSFALDPVCLVSLLDNLPLVLAIYSGTALAMCNGSYMPTCYLGLASAAWLLADSLAHKSLLLYGVTLVFGPLLHVNAYHAELYRLYSLLVALEQFCSLHQIHEGGVLIGCDNKGVICQAQAFQEYVPCYHHHADLLWAVMALCL